MYAIDVKAGTTRVVLVFSTPEACVLRARPGCTIVSDIPDEACRDEKRLLKYIDEVPEEEKMKV